MKYRSIPEHLPTAGIAPARYLLLVILVIASGGTLAATLEGVRMHEAPDYTRVVLDVSSDVSYDLFTLDNPKRVVIDLANTRPHAGFDPELVALARKRVKGVRGSARGADFRIVLDVRMQDPGAGHWFGVFFHASPSPSYRLIGWLGMMVEIACL